MVLPQKTHNAFPHFTGCIYEETVLYQCSACMVCIHFVVVYDTKVVSYVPMNVVVHNFTTNPCRFRKPMNRWSPGENITCCGSNKACSVFMVRSVNNSIKFGVVSGAPIRSNWRQIVASSGSSSEKMARRLILVDTGEVISSDSIAADRPRFNCPRVQSIFCFNISDNFEQSIICNLTCNIHLRSKISLCGQRCVKSFSNRTCASFLAWPIFFCRLQWQHS